MAAATTKHKWIITCKYGKVHTVLTRDQIDWKNDYSNETVMTGAFASFAYGSRIEHAYLCDEARVSSNDIDGVHDQITSHRNAIRRLLEENEIEPIDIKIA